MLGRKVEAGTLAAWLIVSMSGPFALLAGKYDWPGITAGWMLSGILCSVVICLPGQELCRSRAYCLLQLVFLTAVVSYFAEWSQDIWPTGRDFPVVPLTLIVLAVLSACPGAQAASRVGGVLFWLIAALYGVLLLFGSSNMQLSFLKPQYNLPGAQAVFVLMLPAVIQFVPCKLKPVLKRTVYLIGGLFVALSLWTIGGLSAPVAQSVAWPFYEAGKSVSVLGVAERLEAFISVAVTVGCFGLLSMLITAIANLTENIRLGWGKYGAILAGFLAAVKVLFLPQIPVIWLLIGGVVLWIVVPICGGIIFCEKKKKK